MNMGLKIKLLWGGAIVSGVLFLVLFITGIWLLDFGVNSADGNSSLGHVGIIVAGGAGIFLSVVCALFVIYFILKARSFLKGVGDK